MKQRVIFVALALVTASLFVGCSARQGTTQSGPSASAWRNGVKGQWVLHSVDKEGFPTAYSVKSIFEEAPAECFVGSIWNLPNNGRGSITFDAEGTLCAPGAVRNIVWSIHNPGKGGGNPQFQFKKIYPGDKPANVTAGYRLELSYADADQLTLRMPLDLDGKTRFLVFNFERLQ